MKRAAVLVLVLLGTIGFAAIVLVFGSSMQPSAKAKSERSGHDVSSLVPGQYVVEAFGRESPWSEKVLIIRNRDGDFYVYLLPTDSGKVVMPDRWWGWGYYYCSDFRPETDSKGLVRDGGVIRCHDKETPSWGASLWRWSLDGRPTDRWGIEMYSPAFEIQNGILYINK